MSEPKYYWYCFTFAGVGTKTKANGEYSVYIGMAENKITVPEIQNAKEKAEVGEGAVMLAATYLGKMTYSKFKGEDK